MATSMDYIEFVCEQLASIGTIHYKKMFGECMIYINGRGVLLLIDNTPYLKMHDEIKHLMETVPTAIPLEQKNITMYPRYILDVENLALCKEVLEIVIPLTPLPKQKKKKK